jgi:hypothetical protein
MTVELVGNAIVVSGPGRVEDAEALAGLLLSDRTRAVDLTRSGPLHAAVVQALLAFRPAVLGPAPDAFVATWLMPLLVREMRDL